MKTILTNPSDTFFISRYGHRKIIYAFIAFILLALLDLHFFSFLALIYLGFTVFVYRNPERQTPYLQQKSVVSPVDGKVTGIDENTNGFIVTITSSVRDVSILRSAVTSDTTIVKKEGGMLATSVKKSHLLNAQATITFNGDDNIVVRHIAGRSLEQLSVLSLEDMQTTQGSRYGYMNGGVTFVFLPASTRISVTLFERVRAGETLLGYTA
jgi:phosphatidylserine decarboxylase